MDNKHQQTVLITGASSGFGKACAKHLHQKGYRVYGTSRRAPEFPDAPSTHDLQPDDFHLIPMDVNSDRSVKEGVKWILDREGHLDIVINNAGFGLAGAVEDTKVEEAKAQFDTNFFGLVRVCREVLPIMRKQKNGYLICISSIAGLIGIPFQGYYSASKFAIEGLMESLRGEVRGYGIQVVLIEPGDFNTGLTKNRQIAKKAALGSVYEEQFRKTLSVMEEDERSGASPNEIGPLVERIIKKRAPRLRYIIGPFIQKLTPVLKKILPSKVFEWLLLKYYQIL